MKGHLLVAFFSKVFYKISDKLLMKKIVYLSISLIFFITIGCSPKVSRIPANQNILAKIKEELRSDLSAPRKEELKTIQNNMAKYFLHGHGKTNKQKEKIFNQADKYFQVSMYQFFTNIMSEKEGAEASSFYKIKTAPHWTLEEELNYLNKIVSKEETFLTPAQVRTAIKATSFVDLEALGIENNGYLPQEEWNKVMTIWKENASSGDRSPLAIMNMMEELLDPHLKRIRSAGDEFSKNGSFKFSDPLYEKLIKNFLNFYYDNVPDETIKNIANDLISLGKEPANEDIIKAMFMNSGPGMGKTLQQLGKEKGVSSQLAEIMEVIESSNKAVPYHLVEELVRKDGGYDFVSIDEKPLGTGTMAQVHRAIIRHNGEEVVALRFLKPQIEKNTKKDIEILNAFTKKLKELPEFQGSDVPDFEKLLKSIENFLNMEMDIQRTISAQKKAQEIYEKTIKVNLKKSPTQYIDFHVPKIYEAQEGRLSNLHIQEFISEGVKFSEVDSSMKKTAISKAMVELWFEEALFKSGYIHADLHQGNFSVVLSEDPNKVVINIFDFGLVENLDQSTKRSFLLIGAGAALESPEAIARGLAVGQNRADDKAFISMLEEVITKEMSTQKYSPDGWVIWAVKKGYLDNPQLGSLARGGTLIKQLPELAGIEKLDQKQLRNMATKNLMASLVDRKYPYPLNIADKAILLKALSKRSCRNIIKSLFGVK